MDSNSTRKFLDASQFCEDALREWVEMGLGYPQIFIHNFFAQSLDICETIKEASISVAALDGHSSDIVEVQVWGRYPPVIHATAHGVALEMLFQIYHAVEHALRKAGYDKFNPTLQKRFTRTFPIPDRVTIGDWAYAHQTQVSDALYDHFAELDHEFPSAEDAINETEFDRMIARMRRERALFEKEHLKVDKPDDSPKEQSTADGPSGLDFHYAGKSIEQLTPTKSAIMTALWKATGWTLDSSGIAEAIKGDAAENVTDRSVASHASRISKELDKAKIMLRVSFIQRPKWQLILEKLSESQ